MNKNYTHYFFFLFIFLQPPTAKATLEFPFPQIKEFHTLNESDSYELACEKALEVAHLFGVPYPDSAMIWATQAYQLSVVAQNIDLQKKSLVATANYEFLSQKYTESVLTAEKADELFKISPDDKNHLYLLYRLAEGYEFTARHPLATEIYQSCYNLAEKIGENTMLAQLDIKRGNIKQVNDDPNGAYRLYQKAANGLDPNLKEELKMYFQAKLECFDVVVKNRSLFPEASENICSEIDSEIEKIQTTHLDDLLIDNFIELKTRCIFEEGDIKKIKALKLPPISDLNKTTSNKTKLQLRLDLLAKVALSQNKINIARDYSDLSYELATASKNTTLMIESSKIRENILEQQKEYKLAFEVSKAHAWYEKKFYSKKRLENQVKMEGNFLNKEKEMRILLLNEKNATLESKRTYIIIAAFGFSILSLLAIWFFYRTRVKNEIITQQNIAIANQNQELEKLNVTKDHLFSILGHDLRKPAIAFRGISKKVNFLLKKEQYDTLSKFGDEIENEATSLIQLTDNLLNWALSQKDALSYQPMAMNGNELANEITELYKNAAVQKKIEIKQKIEKDLKVFADPNAIHTILRNLIDNAIKFTNEGGLVTLEMKDLTNETEIKISDTGVGIPNSKLQSIFELRDNKSEKGTAGEKGTGLGLHLVKELVTTNKGTIEVESEIENGTVFTIRLPKES